MDSEEEKQKQTRLLGHFLVVCWPAGRVSSPFVFPTLSLFCQLPFRLENDEYKSKRRVGSNLKGRAVVH